MHAKFVSTRELGKWMGLTRQTIRNWIKNGEISAQLIGKNLRITTEEARRVLKLHGLPVPIPLRPQAEIDKPGALADSKTKRVNARPKTNSRQSPK